MGVALVFFESTAALAALGLLGGVRALAGLTKGKVIFLSAAISSVPVTFTHVVEIVAITILLILGVFAVRLGRFRARASGRAACGSTIQSTFGTCGSLSGPPCLAGICEAS